MKVCQVGALADERSDRSNFFLFFSGEVFTDFNREGHDSCVVCKLED
jgi:hypothetical protein